MSETAPCARPGCGHGVESHTQYGCAFGRTAGRVCPCGAFEPGAAADPVEEMLDMVAEKLDSLPEFERKRRIAQGGRIVEQAEQKSAPPPAPSGRLTREEFHQAVSDLVTGTWDGPATYLMGHFDAQERELALTEDENERLNSQRRYAEAELAALRERLAEVEAAIPKLVRQVALMRGHNHWDNTMQHGMGCDMCITHRKLITEAEDIARAALSPGGAKGARS